MSSCNFNAYQAAQSAIEHHGATAHYRAECRRDDCLERGDLESAEMWLRIVAAIEFLAERRTH